MENTPDVSIKLSVDGADRAGSEIKRVSGSFRQLAADVAHVTTAFSASIYGLEKPGNGIAGLASVADEFAGVESRLRLAMISSKAFGILPALVPLRRASEPRFRLALPPVPAPPTCGSCGSGSCFSGRVSCVRS